MARHCISSIIVNTSLARPAKMILTRRQPGDLRWGLPAEFPLVDSTGFPVPVDRRRPPNCHKAYTLLANIEILLSQLPANDTDR